MVQAIWQYIQDPQNHYWLHGRQFIVLCLATVLGAIVVAVPLGLVVARRRVLSFIVANVSGLFRAIPTVAILFGLLAIPQIGIGFKSAFLAFVIIGIPPILLNTVAALQSIDPAAIDAARGMGMRADQILFRIELPLALPVILAGVRTAAVQIIATAPLAAWIGAGGWGEDIELGFFFGDQVRLLAGALPVAILALLTEFLLALIQRAITPQGVRVAQTSTESDAPTASPAVALSA